MSWCLCTRFRVHVPRAPSPQPQVSASGNRTGRPTYPSDTRPASRLHRSSSFPDELHGFPREAPTVPRSQRVRPPELTCRHLAPSAVVSADPRGNPHRSCRRTFRRSPREVWEPEERPRPATVRAARPQACGLRDWERKASGGRPALPEARGVHGALSDDPEPCANSPHPAAALDLRICSRPRGADPTRSPPGAHAQTQQIRFGLGH